MVQWLSRRRLDLDAYNGQTEVAERMSDSTLALTSETSPKERKGGAQYNARDDGGTPGATLMEAVRGMHGTVIIYARTVFDTCRGGSALLACAAHSNGTGKP